MQPSGLTESLDRRAAAGMLLAARREGRRIPGLVAPAHPATVDEGYAIQDELIRIVGAPVLGWKIGSTGRTAQERVGATEPFAGRILADQVRPNGARIAPQESFLRSLQLEFALRLGRDLTGPGEIGREAAAAAVAAAIPTVEIADTRYADWASVGVASLIADNAKDGLMVFGSPVENWQAIDLAAEPAQLFVNDRLVAKGTGGRVLGHPLNSLLWLANDRIKRGDFLRKGQIISTGTCTGNFHAEPGDAVVARFRAFEPVFATFEKARA